MRFRLKKDITNALLGTTAGSRWKETTHCYWCGCRVSYHVPPSKANRATREHLVPLSKGGARSGPNVVVACKSCNNRRGSDTTWVPFHLRDAEVPEIERFAATIKGTVCDHVWSGYQQETRRRWVRRCLLGCGRAEWAHNKSELVKA